MKKVFSVLIVAILVSGVLLSEGCNKYPNGPSVTLRTAKGRISGDWTLKSVSTLSSGSSVSSTGSDDVWSIKRYGTFTITDASNSSTDNGTWEFSSDKTMLSLTYSNGGTITYTIYELRSKSMELVFGGLIYHFEQ